MSETAVQRANYPLGLPPGSVRAILSIFITGMFLLLATYPQPEGAPPARIPLFLFARAEPASRQGIEQKRWCGNRSH